MTTRPTAFARVPRGRPTKDAKPKQDLIRVDATFLERFERCKLSPDLATIMTKTDSKLSIEVSAQESAGYSLISKQGKVVADKTDIKRIQTMGSSITKERKAALGEEVGLSTKFALAAFVQYGLESTDVAAITRFNKAFVGVYRTVNTQFQMISKNVAVIDSVQSTGPGCTKVKNILIEMGRRISTAVGKYLYHRANLAEEATAEKLNAFLFRERVPYSIYEKLSAGLINPSVQGFDLRHFLFPKDPSKGVFLTFKEMREERFRNNMMGLLDDSELLIRLASNDALIRLMINVPETVDLTDFATPNSVASKLASTPFFVLPFEGAIEVTDVVNFLAKNGVRGVPWASGTVLTPPDLLKYYGTIAKRMFYALVSRPQNKADLLGRMFPGFTFDPVGEQQDIFVQLKAWSVRPGSNLGWFGQVRSGDVLLGPAIQLIPEVFNDVVMVASNHVIATTFVHAVTSAIRLVRSGVSQPDPLIFTNVKNLAISLRERRVNVDEILGDKISLSLGKGKKAAPNTKAGVQERSRLSADAKNAVLELRTRGYVALSERMRVWFRLFLDETVQEAVASVFLARLESFLETPLEVDREDRQAFMEADDPDDEFQPEVNLPPRDQEEIADNPDED